MFKGWINMNFNILKPKSFSKEKSIISKKYTLKKY